MKPMTPQRAFWIGWTVLSAYAGITVGGGVTSHGLSSLAPPLAIRLYSGPLFAMFGIRRLDVATILAVLIVMASGLFAERLLRDYLFVNPTQEPEFSAKQHRTFVRLLGTVLVTLDAILFYQGMLDVNSWAATSDRQAAFIITAVYICLMFVAGYFNILLWLKAKRSER